MDNTNEEKGLMKRWSRCGNSSMKCNFYKVISKRDGLHPLCKVCKIG